MPKDAHEDDILGSLSMLVSQALFDAEVDGTVENWTRVRNCEQAIVDFLKEDTNHPEYQIALRGVRSANEEIAKRQP